MGRSKHEAPVEQRDTQLFPTPQTQVETQNLDEYRAGSCSARQVNSCEKQVQRSVTVDTSNGCYDIHGNNVNVYIYDNGRFRQQDVQQSYPQQYFRPQERYIQPQSYVDPRFDRYGYQHQQYAYGRNYDDYSYQVPSYRQPVAYYNDPYQGGYYPGYRQVGIPQAGYPYYGGQDMVDIGGPMGRVRAVTDDGYNSNSGIGGFFNMAYKALGLAAGAGIVKSIWSGRNNGSYYGGGGYGYGGGSWLGGLLSNVGGYGYRQPYYGYRQPYYGY